MPLRVEAPPHEETPPPPPREYNLPKLRRRYERTFGKPPSKRLHDNPKWLATQLKNADIIQKNAELRRQ